MRLLAVAVLLALLAGCVTQSASRPSCTNHVLHEAVAPEGNAKAVVFERDCMTASTIQVSLVPAGDRAPSEPGNAFAVGAGKHSLQGRPVVTVAWSGPTRLTIRYTRGAAVMRSERKVGPIEIDYAFLKEGTATTAQGEPQAQGAR